MKISHAIFAAALAAAAPAFAEAADPQAVKAGAYKIEPFHTQVLFSTSHFGLSNFAGMFSGAEGR